MLAVGATDGTVRLLDLRNEKDLGGPVCVSRGAKAPRGGVRQVAFPQLPPRSSTTRGSFEGSTVQADGVIGNGAVNGSRPAWGSSSSSLEALPRRPSSRSGVEGHVRSSSAPRNLGVSGASSL